MLLCETYVKSNDAEFDMHISFHMERLTLTCLRFILSDTVEWVAHGEGKSTISHNKAHANIS